MTSLDVFRRSTAFSKAGAHKNPKVNLAGKHWSRLKYRKDTEPLFHSFMYTLVSILSGIYPLPAMHSLLATVYAKECVPFFLSNPTIAS